MTGRYYSHNSPQWKIDGLAYDPALEPDGKYWSEKAEAVIAALQDALPDTQDGGYEYWRIMGLWNQTNTWMQIYLIVQKELDRIITNTVAQQAGV